jgi:G3E family GTPase
VTAPRIPLTVVGGYLGAGKTTLINRILTGDHGRRIAVIVNDFGDVSIDESLIVGAEGGVRALANGCVCCSAVDGLATALAEVAALEPAPEHLVIEVSGVGDPWAVAQWGRTPGYELDGVVVVVDPFAIRRWADDRYVADTVRGQLASADVVVMSHADDAPANVIAGVRGWLGGLVDAPVLVGAENVLELVAPRPAGRGSGGMVHGQHRSHDFVPRSATRAEVEEWLADAPPSVVRVKGFVVGPDGVWIAQRFGYRDEVHRADPGAEPWLTVITVGDDDAPNVIRWCAALS